MGIVEIIMNNNNRFSWFSDMSWFKGNGETNHFDPTLRETWDHELNTRSDIDIKSVANIISFFGDSFMYGHGVNRNETVSYYFNEMCDNSIECINFALPGSSNTMTIRSMNQWLNHINSEKTIAMIVNIAPTSRIDIDISPLYPQYMLSPNRELFPPIYRNDDDINEQVHTTCYTPSNPPDRTTFYSETADTSLINKLVNAMYDSYYKYRDNPATALVEIERYLVELFWICKGTGVPMILCLNDAILESFMCDADVVRIKAKLDEFSSRTNGNFKVVNIDFIYNEPLGPDPHLKCGHWTKDTNKRIATAMYNKLDIK
jgi:hypothetical protein